jgi:PAS domain S-box-containing protein
MTSAVRLHRSWLHHVVTNGSGWLAGALLMTCLWSTYTNVRDTAITETLGNCVRRADAAIERLIATLEAAATGQREYLLTGDAAYLEPYDAARTQVAADLNHLPAPFLDGTDAEHIAAIRTLAAAELAELDQTILLRKAGESQAALDRIHSGEDRRLMEAIRTRTDMLRKDNETRLLSMQQVATAEWQGIIGFGLIGSVMLAALALLHHRMRQHSEFGLVTPDHCNRAFVMMHGMVRDQNNRITLWTEGAQRLYGYTPAEALDRISHDLLRTGFPQPLEEIEVMLQRDGEWRGQLTHHRRDGSKIIVASHWSLHRGAAGDAVIEVNNDITDLRRAETAAQENALKLALALDASALGTWVWNVEADQIIMEWDARCRALFGLPPESPVNYPVWLAAVAPADRPAAAADLARALDQADPDDDYVSEFRVYRPDGSMRWLVATGQALYGPDRQVRRLIATIRDVSRSRSAEQRQQQVDTLLHTILGSSAGLIFAKDRQGRFLLANNTVLDLIGRPWAAVEGGTDLELLDDRAQAEAVMGNDRRIMEQDKAESFEELIGTEGGQPRVWFSTKTPLHDSAGLVSGLVGVSVEITDRKRTEDRLHLMVNELNHRVKNTLATVQAIASQTLRGTDPATRRTLEDRLLALASAHDVLTRGVWEGADLAEIVVAALAPFAGAMDSRFTIQGPSLRLQSGPALALALGLHELTTNALRHGALSVATGSVAIIWSIQRGPSASLEFTWTERGGPPVAPPGGHGFGIRLVERSLAQDFTGRAAIDFSDPSGVTCRIEAPLHQVIASADIRPLPRVGGMRRG